VKSTALMSLASTPVTTRAGTPTPGKPHPGSPGPGGGSSGHVRDHQEPHDLGLLTVL
jgi:hypothetical protein